jgi:hypothetical protein
MAKPLRGAEGALDILICSEKGIAVASEGFQPSNTRDFSWSLKEGSF